MRQGKASRHSGGGISRRLLSFAALPFLSLATPFFFFPILARVAGAHAWLAIAVGQSTGAFFSLVVTQGYNLVGPTMINLIPQTQRQGAFQRSVQLRLIVFLPSSIVAFLIAWFVAPDGYRAIAALMSLAMTMTGLSSAWYMIGLGQAKLIIVYEILPKMVATIVAASLVIRYVEVIWYPVLLIVSSSASLTIFCARTVIPTDLLRFRFKELRHAFRANRSALATEMASGSYASLAVTFVSVSASPIQAASYVSGDKLFKLGIYAVGAVGNALQGWVVEHGAQEFRSRARQSFIAHFALGAVGFVSFVALGPTLSALLFGQVVAINQATAWGLGVAILALSLNTSLGRHTLLGLGARREVMISVFAGTVVGVPLILAMSASWGASGGAWGIAASESLVVLVQSIFICLHRRDFSIAEVGGDAESPLSPPPNLVAPS